MGSEPEATTTPTTNALSDSSSASQPSAIDCIQEPTSESVCPIQKERKFRCVMSTRNGLNLVRATMVGHEKYRPSRECWEAHSRLKMTAARRPRSLRHAF